ncbi:MAG: hypothetical protein WD424_02245 [Paenibacillaceae bacterium]
MFAQYFGQFLLNQGLITPHELEKALVAQKNIRVKLGVLAINRGFMTAEQVEAVHQVQTRMDKRFGEIAVELGFIQENWIAELLSAQPSAHLALGQALIDNEIMSYKAFSSALNQYRRENSLSDEQFHAIVNGDIEALLEAELLKAGISGDSVLVNYMSLFAKNMIRFIDSNIRMEIGQTNDSQTYEWVAQQLILSEDYAIHRSTAIAGTEDAFLRLASIYAQENVDTPGEMMEAAIGEFLNLHNGIYLVNRSNQGSELNMQPQSVKRSSQFTTNSPIKSVIQVIGRNFSFDLIITNLSELNA